MTEGYLARSFDLFNVRDVDLIAKARDLCDRLTVAVLEDETVERMTGSPPVAPLHERMKLAGHVRGVDDVVVHQSSQMPCMAEDQTIFRVAGELDPADMPAHAVALVSERETASVQVRRALNPLRSSVA